VSKFLKIKNKIKPFKKEITIEGDKSISIRWALLASQSKEKSVATNILRSEDVLSTLNCLKKLGIKVKLTKKKCEIKGRGLNGFKSKDLILNAGNSGTFGRLILGLLTHTKFKTKIIGDRSLSKRDFTRVVDPLKKFGASFVSKSGKLPITIIGTDNPKAIKHVETKGSAQVKSSIMLAALNTRGTTTIKAKASRNHTELFYKHLKIPIKITKKKNYDLIKVNGVKKIKKLNYKIPSDISSSAFFIVLTILSNNSKLLIKNVNINPSRTGILKILRMMNIKIKTQNIRNYKGEKIADLSAVSQKNIKPIKCPENLNSASIDEFLLIFLLAAKANGISYFKNLSELNAKESPRLIWGSKILNLMGVKNITTTNSIKIFGNPQLEINKNINIKNFLKDHRVFMTCVVAALTFGGEWKIYDKDAINTSFPSFIAKIKELGVKI
tara:strand:- start:312 stop:1631 length:1320 start_codon:yes stop_codon:yes gene_type:complete